jgi:putative membrane protein
VKIGLFVVVAVMSVIPTLAFIRWRRYLDHDPAWQVPPVEKSRMRRIIMIEVHLAALIPVFAVIMSRGLGY